MPQHETPARLRHMLDAAREAAQMAQGRTRADLDTDRPLKSLPRSSARNRGRSGQPCPATGTRELSRHPWPQIVGLRNRLIHGYDNVDFDILWQIVTQDLPPLIAALDKIL